MADVRKPGRPKAGHQQVGRERIVEGVIEYVRAGHSDISRREISSYLKITPALITYYFPKGFSLLTEAVDRQSDRWLRNVDSLCEKRNVRMSQLFDEFQNLIITMYRSDARIVDLQASLWRAGHMPYCLINEMKRRASALFLTGDSQIEREMAAITTSIIWGACEHCVRDHSDEWHSNVFNSEQLMSGHLVVARKSAPTHAAMT